MPLSGVIFYWGYSNIGINSAKKFNRIRSKVESHETFFLHKFTGAFSKLDHLLNVNNVCRSIVK
jgi:hypothetical protein